MKKILILACSCFLIAACNQNAKTSKASEADSTQVAGTQTKADAVDFEGTYEGVLPAADCPGIETTITLNKDKSFAMRSSYLERNSTFNEKGTYTVNVDTLSLKNTKGEPSYYLVKDGKLYCLTLDKEVITGELADHYILTKKEQK